MSKREKWQELFEEVFSEFPDQRILQEARETLEAMNYRIELEDGITLNIPKDAPLLVIRKSLHYEKDAHLQGFFTFDIGVGPHFTELGRFNGVCDYGILRLKFGLDGEYQDETFLPSPLMEFEAPISEADVSLVAETREEYRVEGSKRDQR